MDRKLDLSSLRTYLAFPFQDRDATNRFLVGAALYVAASIITIVPMIPALGYQYQVMRRVVEGERPGMPPWADWGRLFIDGLRMLLIGGAYMLPGFLVFFGGMGLYFFSFFGMMGAGDNPSLAMVMIWTGSMILMFLGFSVGMLLLLLGSIPLPFATAHAIAQDDVSAAFRVRQWWPILRRVRGDFLIGWVIFFGLAGLLYTVYMLLYMTIILCMVLPLVLGVLSFYMFLAGSAIFAAIYRQGAEGLPALEAARETTGPWAPAPTRPGAEPPLEPAAGEMVGVDIAAESGVEAAPPTAVIEEDLAEVFAPELPAAPVDPNITAMVDRSVLLAGSLPDEPGRATTGADPGATRHLPQDSEALPGPAEDLASSADPGATRRGEDIS